MKYIKIKGDTRTKALIMARKRAKTKGIEKQIRNVFIFLKNESKIVRQKRKRKGD